MVNLRYVLVTLIGVFLALALGVVLGAGPLQRTIDRASQPEGETTEGIADQLAAITRSAEQSDKFISAVADEVLPAALKDKSVALVLLPSATTADVTALSQTLKTAGAQIKAQVELTDVWVSTDQAAYRQTLSAAVSAHLAELPADASALGLLAQGLVQVLTQDSAGSELISEMLTDQGTPLVVSGTLPTEAIDSLILVGPSGGQESTTSGQEDSQSAASEADHQEAGNGEFWRAIAAATATVDTSVAVGQAGTESDFIAVLRDANIRLTTVDQGGSLMAAINVVLAIADGSLGAFGQQIGASQVLAPIP